MQHMKLRIITKTHKEQKHDANQKHTHFFTPSIVLIFLEQTVYYLTFKCLNSIKCKLKNVV